MMKKTILATMCLFVAFTFSVSLAKADNDAPREILFSKIDQALDIISKPEFKAANNEALLTQVRDIVYSMCDFQEFTSRTVGAKWRSFTPKQKEDFQDAFSELLYQTYSGKLRLYNGEKFTFIKETFSTDGTKVEISTTFPYENKLAPVNYRLLLKNGTWKVYDIIIENVSLIQNYRGQFANMLDKQSPEKVIETLYQKANEAKNENNK